MARIADNLTVKSINDQLNDNQKIRVNNKQVLNNVNNSCCMSNSIIENDEEMNMVFNNRTSLATSNEATQFPLTVDKQLLIEQILVQQRELTKATETILGVGESRDQFKYQNYELIQNHQSSSASNSFYSDNMDDMNEKPINYETTTTNDINVNYNATQNTIETNFRLSNIDLEIVLKDSSSAPVFAANLLERLFSPSELVNSNVYGRSNGRNEKGKLALNIDKIDYIKEKCKNIYDIDNVKWKRCVDEMNRRISRINKLNASRFTYF